MFMGARVRPRYEYFPAEDHVHPVGWITVVPEVLALVVTARRHGWQQGREVCRFSTYEDCASRQNCGRVHVRPLLEPGWSEIQAPPNQPRPSTALFLSYLT